MDSAKKSKKRKKYVLPKQAVDISKGVNAARFKEVIVSCDEQQPVQFTVQVPFGNRKIGKKFWALVKAARQIPNPHCGQYVSGEVWYKGNLVILHDTKNGFTGETRAFTYNAYGQKGKISRRGMMFQLIDTLKRPGKEKLEQDSFTSMQYLKWEFPTEIPDVSTVIPDSTEEKGEQ